MGVHLQGQLERECDSNSSLRLKSKSRRKNRRVESTHRDFTPFAMVCMRPSDFSMPVLGTLYFLLVAAACNSLPIPILAYITLSNSRRKHALLILVFLLLALATTLLVWAEFRDLLAFILSQLALCILLVALRFRGVRIIADG